MKNRLADIALVLFIMLLMAASVYAGSVLVMMDSPKTRNDETDLTNLKELRVYGRQGSGSYQLFSTVAATITGTTYSAAISLPSGTYEFVVTAVDTGGLESDYSAPVIKFVRLAPVSTPTIRNIIDLGDIVLSSLVTYPSVTVGSSQLKYLAVQNVSLSTVSISAASDNPAFVVTTAMPATIAAGATKRIGIKAVPIVPGFTTGNVTLTYNNKSFAMPLSMVAK